MAGWIGIGDLVEWRVSPYGQKYYKGLVTRVSEYRGYSTTTEEATIKCLENGNIYQMETRKLIRLSAAKKNDEV